MLSLVSKVCSSREENDDSQQLCGLALVQLAPQAAGAEEGQDTMWWSDVHLQHSLHC